MNGGRRPVAGKHGLHALSSSAVPERAENSKRLPAVR